MCAVLSADLDVLDLLASGLDRLIGRADGHPIHGFGWQHLPEPAHASGDYEDDTQRRHGQVRYQSGETQRGSKCEKERVCSRSWHMNKSVVRLRLTALCWIH